MERLICCICNVDLSDRDDLENRMCYSCVVGDPMELNNWEGMYNESTRNRSCRV